MQRKEVTRGTSTGGIWGKGSRVGGDLGHCPPQPWTPLPRGSRVGGDWGKGNLMLAGSGDWGLNPGDPPDLDVVWARRRRISRRRNRLELIMEHGAP